MEKAIDNLNLIIGDVYYGVSNPLQSLEVVKKKGHCYYLCHLDYACSNIKFAPMTWELEKFNSVFFKSAPEALRAAGNEKLRQANSDIKLADEWELEDIKNDRRK